MTRRHVVWASTSMTTRGGVGSFVRTMHDTPLWDRWDIEHVSTHRNGSKPARIGAFANGLVVFLRALVNDRPDVVHLHTSIAGSFIRKATLAWVASVFRVPVVLHVHGSSFDRFHDRASFPIRLLIRSTLARAAVVVALGERWRQRLQKIAPDARVVVVPNAVRPATRVDQSSRNGPLHVLFLGEIGDRKGTFTLLEAWARIAEGTNSAYARLTVAGDGEVGRARERVRALALTDTVALPGWVPPEAVPQLLDSAHVLVLPSRDEGQPMAILEGMARGLCVVASTAGGIPDLVDDSCGVLIPADDTTALAAALERVLCDELLRTRLGLAAWERIRSDFDVDVVWRRFDDLYEELRR
ncbi:glycosyltransferase family 4 protein [Rhodococcus ruber]